MIGETRGSVRTYPNTNVLLRDQECPRGTSVPSGRVGVGAGETAPRRQGLKTDSPTWWSEPRPLRVTCGGGTVGPCRTSLPLTPNSLLCHRRVPCFGVSAEDVSRVDVDAEVPSTLKGPHPGVENPYTDPGRAGSLLSSSVPCPHLYFFGGVPTRTGPVGHRSRPPVPGSPEGSLTCPDGVESGTESETHTSELRRRSTTRGCPRASDVRPRRRRQPGTGTLKERPLRTKRDTCTKRKMSGGIGVVSEDFTQRARTHPVPGGRRGLGVPGITGQENRTPEPGDPTHPPKGQEGDSGPRAPGDPPTGSRSRSRERRPGSGGRSPGYLSSVLGWISGTHRTFHPYGPLERTLWGLKV